MKEYGHLYTKYPESFYVNPCSKITEELLRSEESDVGSYITNPLCKLSLVEKINMGVEEEYFPTSACTMKDYERFPDLNCRYLTRKIMPVSKKKQDSSKYIL